MSPHEHRQAFLTFVAGLLADYDRYLQRGDINLKRNLVGYRQSAMYLSDTEGRQLLRQVNALLDDARTLPPTAGRSRRLVTTILMPGNASLNGPVDHPRLEPSPDSTSPGRERAVSQPG